MILVKLHRTETGDDGTFGSVEIPAYSLSFVSGELPWERNTPDRSCIPPGSYKAVWAFSPRFQKMTYLLKDVPGRAAIRVHGANFCGSKSVRGLRSQLDGCIALATDVRLVGKQLALINSAPAVREFENRLLGQDILLEITQPWPALYDIK